MLQEQRNNRVAGTKIENSTKYTMSYGNDIASRNLDWTQLKIRNTSYTDEMRYIVEFNFSSGVSINKAVKLDVVGEFIVWC